MQQANARHHLMRPPLQLTEHLAGFTTAARLAKQCRPEGHYCVSANYQVVGEPLGNDSCFAVGVELSYFARSKMFLFGFRRVAPENLEAKYDVPQ